MPATKNTLPRLLFAAVLVSAAVGLLSVAHRAEAQKPSDFSLSNYRDKNRLALVFAPSKSDNRFVKQKALWETKNEGFSDRDLVRFTILTKGKSTAGSTALSSGDAAALRRRFGIKANEFRVLLIGKDGHTAYSTEYPASASDLFRRIDKMPMRRDEIKRRGR